MSNGLINALGLYESNENNPKIDKDRLRVATKDLVLGVDYDRIDVTYPISTQEIYDYKLSTSTVRVVEVNYLTAAKKDITSVIIT